MSFPNSQNGEEYQTIFENAVEGIFQSSLDGRFLNVNPAMARIYGYKSPKEMIASVKNISKQIYVNAKDRKEFIDALENDGYVEGFENQNIRKNGSMFWSRTNARIVQDEQDNNLYIEGFVTDITTHKDTENALRASEERYRALVERLPGAVFLSAPNDFDKTFYISPKIIDVLGYSPKEWTDEIRLSEILHHEDHERILAENKHIDETSEIFHQEYRLRRKDGRYVWVREESSLITDKDGTPRFWQGFLLDISEQKQAEQAIRQSEEQFRTVFQATPIAMCITTLNEGRFVDANQAYWNLSVFEPSEVLKHTAVEMGFTTARERKIFISKIKKERSLKYIPGIFNTKSGEKLSTLEFYELIQLQGTNHLLSMFYDITEQKKIEDAIRESEASYRGLFDSVQEAVYIQDEEGRFLDVNKGAVKMYAHPREFFIGKTPESLSAPEMNDLEAVGKAVQKTFKGEPQQFEFWGLRSNGEVFPKDVRLYKGTYFGQNVIIALARDITQQKNVEKMLNRQLEELSILHQAALAASTAKSVDSLIQRITALIGDTLQPDNFGVELVTDRGDMYQAHPSYRGASKKEIRMPIPLSKGITGKVITTRKQIRLGDVSLESAYVEVTKGVRSELCVPIRLQDRIIGTFNLESKKPDAFSEADERLLITVAGTMATAIEQLRHFETSQRRLQELTILNSVSRVSTDANNVDDLIENVTQIIGESLYPDNFGVLLLDGKQDVLYSHPSYRGITNENSPPIVSLWQGVSGQVAATGKPLRIANVRNSKKYIEVTSQVRSELCVPIAHGNRILGVINAESLKIDAFTEDDERLLSTIASTLATAIEKLRLFEAEKKQRKEAEILREATTALTASLNLQTLLDTILVNLFRIVPYTSASIAMNNNGEMYIVAGRGFPGNYKVIGKRIKGDGKWTAIGKERGSIIISDVKSDQEFEQWEGSEYIRSWMGVSMMAHDNVIGYIFIDSHEQDTFTEKDATLVETFANSAAVIIENAHLFEAEQHSRQEAETLREATAALTSSLDLRTLLETILDSLAKVVSYDSASVILAHEDGMEIYAARNLPDNFDYVGKHYNKNKNWKYFYTTRKSIIIPDAKTNADFEKWSKTVVIRGWMGIPLVNKDLVIGYLSLDSHKVNAYTEADANLVQTFANQAAIAIENARLFEAEQRRHRESETLRQAALAITSLLDLESVLETLLIVMKQVVPYDSSSVLLQEGDDLRLAAIQGFSMPEYLVDLIFPANDELYGEIKKSKQSLILEDAQKDNRFKKWGKSQETRGWMGVPLIIRGEVIGCITVDNSQPDAYDSNLAILALTFAQHASTAIQNARQFETEQRHFEEAETLRETAEAITSSLDIRQVLNAILNNLSRVVSFDSVAIFLIEGDKVRLTAGLGFQDNENVVNTLFPASNALLQKVWETEKPLILEDAKTDSRFEKWATTIQVRGWMGVPLISRGINIGYITIDSSKAGAYSDHDANLAMTFAHQAAVAIENAHLFERGEQQIRQLTVLREIDSAISSSFDLRALLNIIIGHATRELKVDAATILLYDQDLQALTFYVHSGLRAKNKSTLSYLRIGEGLAGQVALKRKFISVPNLTKLSDSESNLHLKGENFKSYFGVPLIGKGQITGVLEIFTRNEFDPAPDWINFLHTLAGQAAIAIDSVQTFENLQRRNQELSIAYDTTLEGWGKALELRDKETQGHTDRVVEMTVELARHMGIKGEDLTHIMRGTLLHDIGKMGIPDHILHKPGTLTEEEWVIMRQHPQYALDLMSRIPYLRPALDIPYSHHERWDGSGYPRGIKGKEIPLAARIFAVVDIWDALLYDRVYRAAWTEDKVLEYLKNTAGIELDPTIVEKFLKLLEDENSLNKLVE